MNNRQKGLGFNTLTDPFTPPTINNGNPITGEQMLEYILSAFYDSDLTEGYMIELINSCPEAMKTLVAIDRVEMLVRQAVEQNAACHIR
tara:strand:+ start:633 stop:899 length:267 start_codon:yes stop_codon:yes gene_type:complete